MSDLQKEWEEAEQIPLAKEWEEAEPIKAQKPKSFMGDIGPIPLGGGDMPMGLDPNAFVEGISQVPKKIAGGVAPYAPVAGMAVGGLLAAPFNAVAPGAAEIAGIGLGGLAGMQAQTLLSNYAKDKPLPSGLEMTEQAVRDYPSAATAALAGPVTGAVVGKGLEVAGPALQRNAEKLYAGAIKMPLYRKWTKIRGPEETTKVKEAVRKGLQEEVPPSDFGRQKVKAIKEKHGEQIGKMTEDIPSGPYDLDDIILNGVRNAVNKAKNGEATVDEVNAVKMWAEKYRQGKSQKPSGAELERWKSELYQRSNYDKASGKGDALVETIRKGVAHEMRLALEKGNPALRQVNREWAAARDLEEALERALPRMDNKNAIDLGTKVLIGRESWPLAIINQTIGHPQIKARLAFAMNRMANRMHGLSPIGY